MTTTKWSIESFPTFIGDEREKYGGPDNNKVTFSLSQVARYLRFLVIIKVRYTNLNQRTVESFRKQIADAAQSEEKNRTATDDEMRQLQEDARLHEELHLEIETFFTFAKTALDKIAHCIEDYFGAVRGTSLQSHNKLCKGIEDFAKAKQLSIPDGMCILMTQLRSEIADYRDKQIVHFNKNPRAMRLTFITGSGKTQLGTTYLYPKEQDRQAQSPSVDDAYGKLDQYVNCFVELIINNRGQTRYQLDAG